MAGRRRSCAGVIRPLRPAWDDAWEACEIWDATEAGRAVGAERREARMKTPHFGGQEKYSTLTPLAPIHDITGKYLRCSPLHASIILAHSFKTPFKLDSCPHSFLELCSSQESQRSLHTHSLHPDSISDLGRELGCTCTISSAA